MSTDIETLRQIEAIHHHQLVEITQRLRELPSPYILDPLDQESPYSILHVFSNSFEDALNQLESDKPFIYPNFGTNGKDLFHLRFWKVANTLQALVVLLPLIEPLYNPKSAVYPNNPNCHLYPDASMDTEGAIHGAIRESLKQLKPIYRDFLKTINEPTYSRYMDID